MIDHHHHHEHIDAAVHVGTPLITFHKPTAPNVVLFLVVAGFCIFQLWSIWKEGRK